MLVGVCCVELYLTSVQSLKEKRGIVKSIKTRIAQKFNVSIAEVLQENSSIQVQEYGAKGSVQSLLIRGLTSSHTKVKWNGLQINSLTLGMFDFGGVNGFGNNYFSNIKFFNSF